ncbi:MULTISPECIES: galactokinase [Shewanella]|jgi:galactokinase|uniref:Galactokinase n=1 Tax=Shewanella psychromarinicola TaxID=2487742 RepID=A0A3N4E5M8_9GAMM|nr:galactokinase [Shewanella psychromarinicola]AZG34668.1 galactokinase [Shewanella psychromarinicola]MCL1083063.1 galactokinase [Shewanella psychromarinicola]RPA33545.1 galactokinase [Shewanella psychromarinicola]
MSNPAQRATKLFVQTFGTKPDDLYQAPGRVNIMGEHTDYNEGLVLPAAINFHTVIAVKHRDDNLFRAVTTAFPGQIKQWHFGEEGAVAAGDDWCHYLKGVTAAMNQSGLRANGLDLAIVGDVPLGAGLSSSAALEIAFGTAISYASQLHLSPLAIAQLAQRGQSQFMQLNCGMMDQIISAMAQPDHALLIDCLELESEAVLLPEELSLIVIDLKQDRHGFTQQFEQRKQECNQITALLGLDSLRDLSLSQLTQNKDVLSNEQFRRARHIITENQRTSNAARALQQNNIPRFSQLMAQSQASMRDDFDIITVEIDTLVTMIATLIGEQGGVRMSDGCVLALVNHDLTDKVINVVENQYFKQTGIEATIHLCSASGGAGRIG